MNELMEISHACFDLNYRIRKIKYLIARSEGLNSSEYEVLSYLFHSGEKRSIKEVSKFLLLCSQAVTKITKKLVQEQYIELEKSSTDRRVTYLVLTTKGEALARTEESQKLALFAELERYADKKELKNMSRVFKDFVDQMAPMNIKMEAAF